MFQRLALTAAFLVTAAAAPIRFKITLASQAVSQETSGRLIVFMSDSP
jgi:hypothetical protein